MWSDELEGKMVFFADYIPQLKQRVENNIIGHYAKVTKGEANLPFRIADGQARMMLTWTFAYYDPHYEIKVAREEGKTIQVLYDNDWYDITPDYELIDDETYRIEPKSKLEEEKLVTYRDLAMWLFKGNGEFFLECEHIGGHGLFYTSDLANEPIPERFSIRKWEDSEWVKPTRKYMGLDG